jgi:hypothetical protein
LVQKWQSPVRFGNLAEQLLIDQGVSTIDVIPNWTTRHLADDPVQQGAHPCDAENPLRLVQLAIGSADPRDYPPGVPQLGCELSSLAGGVLDVR